MTWSPDPMAGSSSILEPFIAGRRRILDAQDAVEIMCALQSEVSRASVTRFPEVAADCFCGHIDRKHVGWTFENNGDSLRWIIETVRGRLAVEGHSECHERAQR